MNALALGIEAEILFRFGKRLKRIARRVSRNAKENKNKKHEDNTIIARGRRGDAFACPGKNDGTYAS